MGLNQFHDILPGSAIAWVHRQARADYVRDIARLRDIAGTLEPAKEKLAGVLSEPAYSSVIHHVAVGHAHIDSAWL